MEFVEGPASFDEEELEVVMDGGDHAIKMAAVGVEVVIVEPQVFDGLVSGGGTGYGNDGAVRPMREDVDCKGGAERFRDVFVTPLKVESSNFRDCDVEAKDDTERRDHVCFRLESGETGTHREKIVSIARVLCPYEFAVLSAEVEGGVSDGGEGPEEDIEEAVPIDRGGDVPLSCACDSLEVRCFAGIVRAETVDTFGAEDGAGIWRADDCESAIIEVYEIVRQEGRNAHPSPRHAKDRFRNPVESFGDIPGGSI